MGTCRFEFTVKTPKWTRYSVWNTCRWTEGKWTDSRWNAYHYSDRKGIAGSRHIVLMCSYFNWMDTYGQPGTTDTPYTRCAWGTHERDQWWMVTNILEKLVVLHRHMCFSINTGKPESILVPTRHGGSEPTSDVNIVEFKKAEHG